VNPDPVNCDYCSKQLEDVELLIQWDDGSPDTNFCSDDCLYSWIAANNGRWKNPRAQVDVDVL